MKNITKILITLLVFLTVEFEFCFLTIKIIEKLFY